MRPRLSPWPVVLSAAFLWCALPGAARAQCPEDADQDGYVALACTDGDDCDDLDPFVHPEADELCDGVDNDCDQETDEAWAGLGQACDGADPDQCQEGQWACAADQLSVECVEEGAGNTELCNALDDDCDGETDEDWTDLGLACDGPDGDRCARGALVCAPSGDALECLETEPGDGDERCNALDDDCDGETDEDFGDYVCGLGECQVSVPQCLAGVPQACEPGAPPEPDAELSCEDGLDNDCDGFADVDDVADCGEGGGGDGCGCATRSGAPPVDLAGPLALLLLGLALALRRAH